MDSTSIASELVQVLGSITALETRMTTMSNDKTKLKECQDALDSTRRILGKQTKEKLAMLETARQRAQDLRDQIAIAPKTSSLATTKQKGAQTMPKRSR